MPCLVGRCQGQARNGLWSGVAAVRSRASATTPCFVSQPVDNQQALVRRESAVNLENFKKQYVRRRWKVCQGLGVGAGAQAASWFPQGLRAHSHLALPSLSLPQLSFSIVSLCNHLTRSLLKKVHLRPDEDLVSKNRALFLSGILGWPGAQGQGEQVGLNCFQPVLLVLSSSVLCDQWRPRVQGDHWGGAGRGALQRAA